MSVQDITTNDLRRMKKTEGLVFQGCGGDPQEWINGINEMLTTENILLQGSKFNNVFRFQRDAVTCLLFPFDPDVKLDTGKLAMWRLATHSQFGATWLSDFVPNELGGYLGERVKDKYGLLDEACRQWCALSENDRNRMDGVGFREFYEKLSLERYKEYRRNPKAFSLGKTGETVVIPFSHAESLCMEELIANALCGYQEKNTEDTLLDLEIKFAQVNDEGMSC